MTIRALNPPGRPTGWTRRTESRAGAGASRRPCSCLMLIMGGSTRKARTGARSGPFVVYSLFGVCQLRVLRVTARRGVRVLSVLPASPPLASPDRFDYGCSDAGTNGPTDCACFRRLLPATTLKVNFTGDPREVLQGARFSPRNPLRLNPLQPTAPGCQPDRADHPFAANDRHCFHHKF